MNANKSIKSYIVPPSKTDKKTSTYVFHGPKVHRQQDHDYDENGNEVGEE